MYTEEEIKEIRELTKPKQLSSEQTAAIKTKFGAKKIPGHIFPFIRLFATNPDLYNRITEDERAKEYSIYGFFPETYGMVYGSEISPQIDSANGNRGLTILIMHPTKNIAIKPIQNSLECEVAQIAHELEVGPRQYQSLEGFITEDFIKGEFFSMLGKERLSNENIYKIGLRMGDILHKLHGRQVYYNDTTLSDDNSKSHLIVPKDPLSSILIDYGVALRLDNHPNLTDEQIFNYARTLPQVKLFLQLQQAQHGFIPKEFIESTVMEYKPEILQSTIEKIMQRDSDFINEGFWLASMNLGKNISEPFLSGFKETYYSQ